jgi:hypothetical protein
VIHKTRIWTDLSFDVIYTVASDTDSDSDGLPNYWERHYGLDPFNDSGDNGANADIDGDGLTNAQEYGFGTNPQMSDTDADGAGDALGIFI